MGKEDLSTYPPQSESAEIATDTTEQRMPLYCQLRSLQILIVAHMSSGPPFPSPPQGMPPDNT